MKNTKTKNVLKQKTMARYLDPKNDLIFKLIFGEHPDLLMSFLNALMPFESDRHIVSLEYLPPELVPDTPGKKDSIVDVRCKDNYGRNFIIEMQIYWYESFYNRVIFNAGKVYVRQLDKKEKYHLLQPVYTLALLNENFDHKTEQFYHHFQIVNRENTDEIIPGLEFIFVELQKFKPEAISDRKLAILWLRFLNEVGEELRRLPPELEENEYIRRASDICEEAAFTPDVVDLYDRYWDGIRWKKEIRDELLRRELEKGLKRGEKKGIKRGVAEGLKKGKEMGLKKGKEMGLKKGEEMGLKKGKEMGLKKGEEMGLKKGEEMGLKKGEEMGLKKGKEMGLKKGKEMGLKKGEEMGLKKGEEMGLKKGEEMGLKKGKEMGLKKGEEMGLKKGEEMGLKKGEEMGLKKGEEMGLKKGKEMGLKKGEEMGLKKGEEKLREREKLIVINCHNAGFSIENIAKITDLPITKIIEIIEKVKE
ncbi:MAG: Rpn family recombination-promoting nuclease/putative transposase [Bacteroidales bacterium]|jgi:predicted transposase/invertase (TIGR01784 family)|nr:Rpn family recombination-promoting nuclease/putative transposase [Bacteroidales bacterium]